MNRKEGIKKEEDRECRADRTPPDDINRDPRMTAVPCALTPVGQKPLQAISSGKM